MPRYDVLSICNALVDILIEIDEARFSKLGLTKSVMHLVDPARQAEILQTFPESSMKIELGGSCMNATRTAAALGAKTFYVGMVGKDNFGSRINKRMAELGIDSGVKETNASTGSCVVLITPEGERTMVTSLGASSLYNESIVPHDEISQARILHFAGYQWSTPQQKEAIYKASATAKKSKTLVSFDVADPFMVQHCGPEFREFIKTDADIVFANEAEAKGLYDGSPETAAKAINDSGAIAVIKLGARGAMISENHKITLVEPVPTKVVDTTGAGDMFAGGFLYAYSQGKSLEECGQIATIMASDVISRVGASFSNQAVEKAKRV